MKKVLILTCSTGEGHNSAAHAIETELRNQGFSCELKDPVSFQSERMKQMVSSLYNNTIKKAPAVFGAVYKLGDLYSSTKLPSPVYWANAHYSEALKAYILENGFDAVICTHLYGMEAMTAISRDEDFKIPCYGVLTDYACIPFIGEISLTGLFVPSQDIKQQLTGTAMPEESIVVSGIPVNETFRRHMGKSDARKELQIPENGHVYLIMTGGIGCENMEGLCDTLLHHIDSNDLILVLTGRNEELKAKLESKYPENDAIRTVAFTKQVAQYMAAADVMLSKPGGLSSTEAAVANIPLVHIHAIPGCETYNAQFFLKHGMSLTAKNDEQAAQYAIELVHDEQASEKMRAMQRRYVNANASGMIVSEVSKTWSQEN